MFDIGFLELMMIGIVSLVVIGPERLPEVAAKVGKTVAKAQRFVRGVKSDINRELESGDLKALLGDQKKQIEELRQMVHTAGKDIQSSTSDAINDAEKSFAELSDASDMESSSESTQTTATPPAQLTQSQSTVDNPAASSTPVAQKSEASSSAASVGSSARESVSETTAKSAKTEPNNNNAS